MTRTALGEVSAFGILTGVGAVDDFGIQPAYGAGGGLSATLSTFVSADYTPTADGVTQTALTFTAKDGSDAALEGVGVTASIISRVTVSAAQSDVSAASTTPVDTATPVTIVIRDANGNGIAGIPAEQVVLSASGSNNTIVQPTGFTDATGAISGATYTATTVGSRTLTVTVGGLALSDQPVVGVGEVDLSGTPNQPVGYTAIVDQPFDVVLFTDSGVTWLNGDYPNGGEAVHSIVTDGDAPESPSNALRFTYPIGYDSANGPGRRECAFGENYQALYTCLWVKPSTTWENHPSGVNKMFYWTAVNTPDVLGTAFLSMFFNGTAAPTAFRFITQNPSEDQVTYTTTGFTPQLGEWHRIEVLQERTSGINGRVRIWCANETTPTATLCLDETGVQLTDAAQTDVSWSGAILDPYWGGNSGIATQEFTLDFDHLIMTGSAA